MPRHTLTYSVEEIERLVTEDAIRRGFTEVSTSLESYTPPMNIAMQQGGLGSGVNSKPFVRAVVTAANIKES